MSTVKIQGNASGSGAFTIAAPSGNTDRTLTLPDASVTVGVGQAQAWVNFNGTGTVAIRGSANVSSITDNGTGNYNVNFSTAMSDTNYSVSGSAKFETSNNNFALSIGNISGGGNYTTTSLTVNPTTGTTSTRWDCVIVNVQVFR